MTPQELRVWRASRDLTQDHIAEMLGVSRKTVGRWEKGENPIPNGTLDTLEAKMPGAAQKLVARQPAILSTRRVRAFPWAQRDYAENEIDRLPAGAKVWHVSDPAEPGVMWRIKIMLATRGYGKGLHIDRCDVTLPLEAFPDPLGQEASFARPMFDARMATYTASFLGLRQAMKDSGIPEE